ncbi:SAP domain-containing protein [Dactylosporangium sucinum]|uniref:SAP domain-containing protein n=1 Tax=Dactylosporangium sucinum TaxID=1424081 RepID=A0A917TWM5_9ACTN|nr:SAP domain-containing protein [Dactylosporangium sucinum]GGM42140.1 hypothetical protein GCM10007977_049590 [Dactylosporangium sucinum]
MTDPADLAHEVLLRVAAFVKALPADQLQDLASGAAKLELVPKGGRPAKATAAAGKPLPRPVAEIETTLRQLGNRADARRYLEVDLKLTAPQLKELAKAFGVTATGLKPKLLDTLVEWAVGRRLDADAITRMTAER